MKIRHLLVHIILVYGKVGFASSNRTNRANVTFKNFMFTVSIFIVIIALTIEVLLPSNFILILKDDSAEFPRKITNAKIFPP